MKTPGKFVSKMNRPALANARHQVLTAVPATKLALVGPMALLKVKHIYLTHAHVKNYIRTCMGRNANPAEEFISIALESFSSNVATL